MLAIEKIKKEYEAGKEKLTQKGKAVGQAVIKALTEFCGQNGEFAQAIEQSDKKVTECIEHTVKGCGNAISDFEVYRRAVDFYFKGATVEFQMVINLGDGGFSNVPEATETQTTGRLELKLDSLLDF